MTERYQQLGRFKIKDMLGDGSMGEVYRAHDPLLKRDVAVKIVKFPKNLEPELIDKMKQALFKEARLAARLSHPGIVQVYDVDEESKSPFIVMELIRGTPLSQFLKNMGRIDVRTAETIFSSILSAMSYAHEQGIIHLDLKPGNIILDKEGAPKIMDFGIARSTSELMGINMEISGTPLYMSPEQIAGKNVDPRSDVYSLGVILYQMLTGRLPLFNKNLNKLRYLIINKPYTPIGVYKADLSKPYIEFIDRTLEKIPAHRFDSAISMYESFKKDINGAKSLKTDSNSTPLSDYARTETFNFIMQRMKRKGDFPAVSEYVTELTKKIRSKKASSQKIAQIILKDVSLTKRILMIANSAYYKGLGSSVTTISRAVVLLGVNAILNMASALTIFEHFLKDSDTTELKFQVMQAILTGLNAREIADKIRPDNSEENFICGMFHHIGLMIVSFYFPEEHKAINSLINDEKADSEEASREVMRMSYNELSLALLSSWNMPDTIKNGIIKMNPDTKGPLKNKAETMQCITSYGHELSCAAMINNKNRQKIELARLSRRFEDKISIKNDDLQTIIRNSLKAASEYSEKIRVHLEKLKLVPTQINTIENNAEVKESKKTESVFKKNTVSKPPDTLIVDAQPNNTFNTNSNIFKQQKFLSKTITDIAKILMGKFSLNDIIMMVLEGIFLGIDMQNVLLSMVSAKRNRLSFVSGIGHATDQLSSVFNFSMASTSQAPVSCITNRQEIIISDFKKNKETEIFPENITAVLDPKCIVVIPVIIQNTALGLFMATRSKGKKQVNSLDLQNMRMLVNHFVLALYQSKTKN